MVRAGGVRIGWADLPGTIRHAIEKIIDGGPVVEASSQPGGFSPGTAYLQHKSRQPPPPGLPTVRAFQRFHGDAMLTWLRGALP